MDNSIEIWDRVTTLPAAPTTPPPIRHHASQDGQDRERSLREAIRRDQLIEDLSWLNGDECASRLLCVINSPVFDATSTAFLSAERGSIVKFPVRPFHTLLVCAT